MHVWDGVGGTLQAELHRATLHAIVLLQQLVT